MKCPVCDVTLSISAREGVEIDFCPQCRGVWLDRGELDKIIDRVATTQASPDFDERSRERAVGTNRVDEARRDEGYRDDGRSTHGTKKKRRRNFLEDIFDFG